MERESESTSTSFKALIVGFGVVSVLAGLAGAAANPPVASKITASSAQNPANDLR